MRVADLKSKLLSCLPTGGSAQTPSGSWALLWANVELGAVELQQLGGEANASALSLASHRPCSMSHAQELDVKQFSGLFAEVHSLARATAGSAPKPYEATMTLRNEVVLQKSFPSRFLSCLEPRTLR